MPQLPAVPHAAVGQRIYDERLVARSGLGYLLDTFNIDAQEFADSARQPGILRHGRRADVEALFEDLS